jgi:hypothetical protein
VLLFGASKIAAAGWSAVGTAPAPSRSRSRFAAEQFRLHAHEDLAEPVAAAAVAAVTPIRIWQHVQFNGVIVPRHGGTQDRYVFLSGNCSWDPEHGVELLFKNGRLFKVDRANALYVSDEWDQFFTEE